MHKIFYKIMFNPAHLSLEWNNRIPILRYSATRHLAFPLILAFILLHAHLFPSSPAPPISAIMWCTYTQPLPIPTISRSSIVHSYPCTPLKLCGCVPAIYLSPEYMELGDIYEKEFLSCRSIFVIVEFL
jgi:hypothetical protein